MPTLTPVDATFVEVAPEVVVVERNINAPPSSVWAAISSNGLWTKWYPGMTRCQTTSARYGLGSTRSVKLGQLAAKEKIVSWEPDALFGFTVTHTNLPLASHMYEQIEIEPEASGKTPQSIVRYTGAFQPYPLTKLTFRFSKRMIQSSWTAGLDGLASFVTSTDSKPEPRSIRNLVQ